ncbi:MAG: F0F1 ATP synthase subunit beta, partial [Chloroflexus aggregans]
MPAKGVIQEIIGVVIRAKFPEDQVPEIYNAIEIPLEQGGRLVCEVQQQLGNGVVKAVAMGSTD